MLAGGSLVLLGRPKKKTLFVFGSAGYQKAAIRRVRTLRYDLGIAISPLSAFSFSSRLCCK